MQDVSLRSCCLPAGKDIKGNKRLEWPQCCFPYLLHFRVETCISSGQVRCFASSWIVVGMSSGLLVCKCCLNLIWNQCGTSAWRLIFCIQMRDTFQINLHRHLTLFLSFMLLFIGTCIEYFIFYAWHESKYIDILNFIFAVAQF